MYAKIIDTFEERLSTVGSYLLVTLITRYSVWSILIYILRPIDIVSLVRAIVFKINLIVSERQIYIK